MSFASTKCCPAPAPIGCKPACVVRGASPTVPLLASISVRSCFLFALVTTVSSLTPLPRYLPTYPRPPILKPQHLFRVSYADILFTRPRPRNSHRGPPPFPVQIPGPPKDHRQQELGLHPSASGRVHGEARCGRAVDRWGVRAVLKKPWAD